MASRILGRRAVTFGLAGTLCMPSILRAQTNYPDRRAVRRRRADRRDRTHLRGVLLA